MKAHALDWRKRVVKFINQGGSKVEAARRFDLGRRTVYRYLAAAQTGTLAPKQSWGHWRKLDPQKLQVHVKAHPDATLTETLNKAKFSNFIYADGRRTSSGGNLCPWAWVCGSVLVWLRGWAAFFTSSAGLIHGFSRRGGSSSDHHIGESKERVELMPVLG